MIIKVFYLRNCSNYFFVLLYNVIVTPTFIFCTHRFTKPEVRYFIRKINDGMTKLKNKYDIPGAHSNNKTGVLGENIAVVVSLLDFLVLESLAMMIDYNSLNK